MFFFNQKPLKIWHDLVPRNCDSKATSHCKNKDRWIDVLPYKQQKKEKKSIFNINEILTTQFRHFIQSVIF